MNPVYILAAGAVGAVVGFLADRLATRWPLHEAGTPGRGLDWRTALLVAGGVCLMAL